MDDRPPVKPTPADLLMIFQQGVKLLEEVRDSNPNNADMVDGIGVALSEALREWMDQRVQLRALLKLRDDGGYDA